MDWLRPDLREKKIFIFDMDGTLTTTISGRVAANEASDVVLLPGVKEKLLSLRAAKNLLYIATQQGGVSFGFMPKMKAWDILLTVNAMFNFVFDDINVCFYHPKGRFCQQHVDRRKPKPDLLVEIIDYVLMRRQDSGEDYGSLLEKSVFVGNAYSDEGAARSAGISFVWAHEFFGWDRNDIETDSHGFKFKDYVLNKIRDEALNGSVCG